MFHFFCFISSCELAQAEEIKKERNDDETQRDGGAGAVERARRSGPMKFRRGIIF